MFESKDFSSFPLRGEQTIDAADPPVTETSRAPQFHRRVCIKRSACPEIRAVQVPQGRAVLPGYLGPEEGTETIGDVVFEWVLRWRNGRLRLAVAEHVKKGTGELAALNQTMVCSRLRNRDKLLPQNPPLFPL